MSPFETAVLPAMPSVRAPDGSDVRVLLELERGSFAHFELGPREVSRAVSHRTIEEIWYFVSGRGQMWRRLAEQEEIVTVSPGVCITIPAGTRFQFRAFEEPLAAVAVTMPPWPGPGEAELVEGPWQPTVAPGPH